VVQRRLAFLVVVATVAVVAVACVPSPGAPTTTTTTLPCLEDVVEVPNYSVLPGGLLHAAGSLWVVDFEDGGFESGRVVRLNPVTLEEEASIPVRWPLYGLAFDGSEIWVPEVGGGSVARISPVTNQIVGRVTVRGLDISGAVEVAFGSIWVSQGSDRELIRIDPVLNQVVARLDTSQFGGFKSLTGGSDALWATTWSDDTLVRLDPATGSVTDQLVVPGKFATKILERTSNGLLAKFNDNSGDMSLDVLVVVDEVSRSISRTVPAQFVSSLDASSGSLLVGVDQFSEDGRSGLVGTLDGVSLTLGPLTPVGPLVVVDVLSAGGAVWVIGIPSGGAGPTSLYRVSVC
jgi:hypothetical protein